MERVCPECGTKTEDLTCPNDGEMTLVIKQEKEESIIGKIIGGRYRVTEIIGQGGFGAVYKCDHIATGDTLAIKVLRTDVEDNLDVVARFRQEAKATSRLKHPNTVRVFDFGQMDDGNLFLAMEFLDGRTLTDLMRKEGPLEPERLVKIGTQVLKSLSEAHSKGLVHRDLKPDNIFVQNIHGEPDFVRVLDFGIAKSLTADQQDITSTGAVIGTPKYMSPEQARGQPVDQRTDIYSLAVILFEGISGTPPFMAETPLAMILRRVTEEPPRVHDNVALPTPIGLCDAVLKALSRNADDRYETADEFAAALEAALKTPLHLPGGQTVGGGREGAGTGTASYGQGAGDGGDETYAFDPSEEIQAAASVVMTANSGEFDDATAVASTAEIEAAAAAMAAAGAPTDGDNTVIEADGSAVDAAAKAAAAPATPAPSGPATGASASGASAPAKPAPTPVDRTEHIQRAPATAAPAPEDRRSNGTVIAGALVALGILAGVVIAILSNRNNATVVVQGTTQGATMAARPAPPTPPPTAAPAKPAPPAAPKKTDVHVSREPAGATVEIDGVRVLGDHHSLKPGKYVVTAKAEGYEDLKMTIQADGGKMDLPIKLKKKAEAAPTPPPTEPKPAAHKPVRKPTRKPVRKPTAKPPAPKPVVKKPPVKKPPPKKPPKKPPGDGGGLLID